jgi:hypothetical protein
MLEVADIVRLHGAAYCQQYGKRLSAALKRALRDIAACRTSFFGGHVYQCDHCQQRVYSYHSCRNRSCPKCHQQQTDRWLQQQRGRLLPCAYFLLTFTLPRQLRPLARSHPKQIYGALMKAAADALQFLVRDSRYVGARIGALAVLHTWTRAMLFHPHVHMLVTAGGLSRDGRAWVHSRSPKFLVPGSALSSIFSAKFADALRKAALLHYVPAAAWQQNWVVHSQHAGSGDKVLNYLARYLFRIAITNSRLEAIDKDIVRFNYRDYRTRQICHVTLSGIEFIHRFLQHVLPVGLVKVRYYGIFSPSAKVKLERARHLLQQTPSLQTPTSSQADPRATKSSAAAEHIAMAAIVEELHSPTPRQCPSCHCGVLLLVQTLPTQRGRSP